MTVGQIPAEVAAWLERNLKKTPHGVLQITIRCAEPRPHIVEFSSTRRVIADEVSR